MRGICANCGDVELLWTKSGARCAVARRKQRDNDGPKDHTNRKKSYGLTYKEAAELRKQIGYCEICFTTENLCVDHDHKTNLVRGVLCLSCNKGLGFFKDSTTLLRSAIMYLEK